MLIGLFRQRQFADERKWLFVSADVRGDEPLRTSAWEAKQQPVVHRQTDLFAESPGVLFGNTVKGPLFPSTNQNYYRTCAPSIQPKFSVQNQIYRQPVVLFPGNLEIQRIFGSIGHTISPDAQPTVSYGI